MFNYKIHKLVFNFEHLFLLTTYAPNLILNKVVTDFNDLLMTINILPNPLAIYISIWKTQLWYLKNIAFPYIKYVIYSIPISNNHIYNAVLYKLFLIELFWKTLFYIYETTWYFFKHNVYLKFEDYFVILSYLNSPKYITNLAVSYFNEFLILTTVNLNYLIILILIWYTFNNLRNFSKFNLVKTTLSTFLIVFLIFNELNLLNWIIFIILAEFTSLYLVFLITTNYNNQKSNNYNLRSYLFFLFLIILTPIYSAVWFDFYSLNNNINTSDFTILVLLLANYIIVFYIVIIIWILTVFVLILLSFKSFKTNENLFFFFQEIKSYIIKTTNNLNTTLKNWIYKWK